MAALDWGTGEVTVQLGPTQVLKRSWSCTSCGQTLGRGRRPRGHSAALEAGASWTAGRVPRVEVRAGEMGSGGTEVGCSSPLGEWRQEKGPHLID